MPEKEYNVHVVEVDMVCDKCGKGVMRPDWNRCTKGLGQPHACTECGFIKTYKGNNYPHIKYLGGTENPV